MNVNIRIQRLLTSAIVAAFLLGFAAAAEDQPNIPPRRDYASVAAAIEPMIRFEMETKQLPAFSIALVEGNDVVWAQGFGYQDPENKIPATAHTVYRVGSVSKLFTDIAIMQMVESGKINLDAPVSQYISDFHPKNPFDKPITLRELMSHRSGLLREPPVGNYFDPTEPSLEATVGSMNSTELVYPPGTHTKYSNAGIAVVGYALQQMNHEAFPDYLKRAVLVPMGMSESAFSPEPALIRNLAKAYMWSYDGLKFPAPTFELGLAPAGCMYSTVTDLAQFLMVLFNGGQAAKAQVLKRETLEQMWVPQFSGPAAKKGYGLGFAISELDGHRVVGHGGAIYGFATEVVGMPDEKLGVVTVTTMDASNAVVNAVARQALEAMLAKRAGKALPTFEATQPVPIELARKLAGRYGDGKDTIDLNEQEGTVGMLPANGGFETQLRSLGNALVPDGRLDVDPGTKVVPSDDGLRVGETRLNRIRSAQPVPASAFDGLIGEYGWDHDILYVLEKDGKLNVLIEWFEYDPLEQQSTDLFKFPAHGLYDGETAKFTRDGSGRATQVAIGAVIFKRRQEIGTGLQVHPVESIAELRERALAAKPPEENKSYRAADLVDLTTVVPNVKLDIRYATANNFLGAPVYERGKAFLQRPAAEALARAAQQLQTLGYGFLVHDAYRPWYVTKIFWDATPADKKIFVADPNEGSRHNRGCAVDLTLYDLKTGTELAMTGGYDEMSERSYASYPGGTSLQRFDRALLRRVLEEEGFAVYQYEWWHFDYRDWQQYPILNLTFEQLSDSRSQSKFNRPDSVSDTDPSLLAAGTQQRKVSWSSYDY
ncbi:MAG: serine hydrolase [Acidobacteriaceae bacterium]|nr:serine hydrolase [Acidobacteriaceae bacterium]